MQVLKRKYVKCCIVAQLAINNFFVYSQPTSREYQVKAAFVYNFTQFVEWPPSAFSNNQEPMIIGILGDNPFGSYLEGIVAGEKINGHPLQIKYYKSLDEIKSCHVVFINISDPNSIKQIISELKGENTLTVSDNSNFMHYGGMVRFFTKDNKIQFQINPEAAKSGNLVVSSKLLRLAQVFEPTKK